MMPDCPGCGAPLKDGDWTCGRCGAPVAGAGMAASPGSAGEGNGSTVAPPAPGAASGWLPEYQPRPAAAAPAQSGSSGLLRLVVIIAIVAIVAILAVWFFLLRGPSTTGDEFLGTWTASTQQGIATAVVSRDGDAFTVTISGSKEAEKITVPAHLDGADLVITMDDFSQIAGEDDAERFRDALEALAGDFRMVFASVDATHLDLRIVGTSPSGQEFDQTIPLARASPP
jgi:hypothetical protein